MKSLLILVSLFFVQITHAEMLNATTKTPYSVFKAATDLEKREIIEGFETLAKDSVWSQEEADALVSLVSDQAEVSGPDVLEALDQDILNWFYGLSDKPNLFHKVARLSTTPDENTCHKYTLCVIVDKSKQRLYAYYNGRPVAGVHDQPVSTARQGKVTPVGIFSINEIAGVNRRSGLYNGAYMGYAMQIHGHYFIHATSKDQYHKLGNRASAGCIRMYLEAAEKLNTLMRQVGRDGIRVVVKN